MTELPEMTPAKWQARVIEQTARAEKAEARVAELEALAVRMHDFAELVWDHLVPIVEMDNEANDPGTDLHLALLQIKLAQEEGFAKRTTPSVSTGRQAGMTVAAARAVVEQTLGQTPPAEPGSESTGQAEAQDHHAPARGPNEAGTSCDSRPSDAPSDDLPDDHRMKLRVGPPEDLPKCVVCGRNAWVDHLGEVNSTCGAAECVRARQKQVLASLTNAYTRDPDRAAAAGLPTQAPNAVDQAPNAARPNDAVSARRCGRQHACLGCVDCLPPGPEGITRAMGALLQAVANGSMSVDAALISVIREIEPRVDKAEAICRPTEAHAALDPEHCSACRAFVERNAPPMPPVVVKNELWDAAILKVRQLESEIRASGANDREKSNMLHTHSKLWMFATDAWEQEVTRPAQRREARTDYPLSKLVEGLREAIEDWKGQMSANENPSPRDPSNRVNIGANMAYKSCIAEIESLLDDACTANPTYKGESNG